MLKQLSIKNYILISELDIKFSDGFTVITGETGAGKSILVGALSLILGKRADTDVLLEKDEKCVIEGLFAVHGYGLESFFDENELDYDDHCVLRREINKQGKSRAFINDTPVVLPVLKSLGERLVDIHSQHESLLLNESGFQLAILDNFAGNQAILDRYHTALQAYNGLKAELDLLRSREAEMRAEEDYLSFQFNEIEAASLKEDEFELLEDEMKMLSHAEEIKGILYQSTQSLSLSDDNLSDKLQEVNAQLGKVAAYHHEIAELKDRINSLAIELKDVNAGLERLEESIQFDPARLEEVNIRVDMINGLLQKHKVRDIASLLDIHREIGEKLQGISNLDEDIDHLKRDTDLALELLKQVAKELSGKRKEVVPAIEEEMTSTLRMLGMKDAVLMIGFHELEKFHSNGMDNVQFMFSANRGSHPAPISKIASGGELSRLMLSLKSMITKKSLLPTIILDEIDMGVSGDIAGKVGTLLGTMSDNMQLIAITHLPQIAGKAGEHFSVFKKTSGHRTVSGVKRLSDSERIDEIAMMLSNEEVSKAAKETAKELLAK